MTKNTLVISEYKSFDQNNVFETGLLKGFDALVLLSSHGYTLIIEDLRKITIQFYELDFLYREWSLFVGCLGRVIVINGVSSSGKSSLVKSLSKFEYNEISYDCEKENLMFDFAEKNFKQEMTMFKKNKLDKTDIKNILYGFRCEKIEDILGMHKIKLFQERFRESIIKEHNENSFLTAMEIFTKIYSVAQKFIFSGQDVLLDVVLDQEDDISMLHYSFNYYPITIGLLYCSLKHNLQNCLKRTDLQYPDTVLLQYQNFYKLIKEDSIDSCKLFFDRIDKSAVIKILHDAQEYQQNLLISLGSPIDQPSTLFNEYFTLMESKQNIFVTPRIKYDFLITSCDLTIVNTYSSKEIIQFDINSEYDILGEINNPYESVLYE